MAKKCPVTNDYVLYLDCLECENKLCRSEVDTDDNSDSQSFNKEQTSNAK